MKGRKKGNGATNHVGRCRQVRQNVFAEGVAHSGLTEEINRLSAFGRASACSVTRLDCIVTAGKSFKRNETCSHVSDARAKLPIALISADAANGLVGML